MDKILCWLKLKVVLQVEIYPKFVLIIHSFFDQTSHNILKMIKWLVSFNSSLKWRVD
ncbi:hypothetical protein NC653_030125 [Populus alba x Populus x berolinensis]|uniref:Uncharacterized protein n=1 Tax=Populus alba x Populus x berolinensis TaxID=444605 RepID=A0AAD6LVC1_9ROSI|nr:hypothetical protein NC653_030125 [Populus alba x Populus x berolinensis]